MTSLRRVTGGKNQARKHKEMMRIENRPLYLDYSLFLDLGRTGQESHQALNPHMAHPDPAPIRT